MSPVRVASRSGRRVVLLVVVLFPGLLASPSRAGELEVAVQAGRSLPFYSQSFVLDPGSFVPSGYPVETSGGFDLELGGGLTVSGALTWRFSDSLGLEARIDSAEVELQVTGGRVSGNLGDLLPGLPSIPISGDLAGETRIDRLTPVSLNLQIGVGGSARFVVSGGVSYIPATTVAATVHLRLGIDDVPGLPPLTLPGASVTAAATLEGGIGGNLGLGLRVPVGSHVALLFDARAFGFPKRELQWGSGSGSSAIEEALAEALDPIEFQYGYFQATGGLAFTF
jgi:hypothetical protein